MKVMCWLCLAIWVFQLVMAFWNIHTKTPINPYTYVCSLIICITYYVQEIITH